MAIGARTSSSVSTDDAKSVEEAILKGVEAEDIDKYVFMREEKAVPMAENVILLLIYRLFKICSPECIGSEPL